MNVAIVYIATGPYITLWEGFYESAKKYLLQETDKKFFLLTDSNPEVQEDVELVHIEHEEWPAITLHRYKYISAIADKLKTHDVTMFFNANVKFINYCGSEFLPKEPGQIVVVRHIHNALTNVAPFETNKNSKAYVHPSKRPYIAGGFVMAYTYDFLQLAAEIEAHVCIDEANDIVAIWHDESHLNALYHKENGRYTFRELPECYFNPDDSFLSNIMRRRITGRRVLVLRAKGDYFDVDTLKHIKK